VLVARRRKASREAPRVAAPSAAPPRFIIEASVIFAVAFLIRVIVGWQIAGLPISRTPHFDANEYLQWARALAAGNFAWPAPPPHGPGYPFFLSVLLRWSGPSLMYALVVQAILGALTSVLVALFTREIFGRWPALATGMLVALYGPLAWLDMSVLAEGLLLFLSSAALLAASRKMHPLWTGILIGLATITRPTAILLLPVCALLSARTKWRAAGLLLATLLPIAPVTIANWNATHAFMPVQAFGGMNFYLGNAPSRDGLPSARPGGDWERIEPLAARTGIIDPVAEDRFFIRRTLEEIRNDPAAFAALLARKLIWTLQNAEIRDTHSFAFFRQHSAALRYLPSFFVLLGLAAAGMLAADWKASSVRAIAMHCLLAIATCVLLVVGARYRIPLILGLAPFAGLGAIAIAHAAGARHKRRLFTLCSIAILAASASLAWRHAPSENLSEELALSAQSLIKETGQDDEAEALAHRAIAADPKSALAYDTLAILHAAHRDVAGGRAAIAQALRLNDQYAKAHAHAGQLELESGNEARAGAAYDRAADLDPRNVDVLFVAARLAASRADYSRATELYNRVAAIDRTNREALLAAAQMSGAAGNPANGVVMARRALALQEDGETWGLLAVLAADTKDNATADDALRHTEALLGRTPNVQFTEALVRHKQQRYVEADAILRTLLAASPDMQNARALDQMNRAAMR
jgi:tetratricopeptide (TPR) repeat protein